MNRKRFLEIAALLSKDRNAASSLSLDERKKFQEILVKKGYELPKFGVDGKIKDETMGALNKYMNSSAFIADSNPYETKARSYSPSASEVPLMDGGSAIDRLEESRLQEESDSEAEANALADFKGKRDRTVKDVSNIAGLGLNAFKLAQSLSQIKQGKEQLKNAQRPELNLGSVSPELQRNYYDALKYSGKGFTDSELASLNQSSLSNYSNAMAASKQGQAANTAQNIQALYGAGLKNNLRVASENAQRNISNRNNVYSAANALNNDRVALRNLGIQHGYLPRLDEYRKTKGQGAYLAALGKSNLSNQMEQMRYSIPNMVKDYYGRKVTSGQESALDYNNRIAAKAQKRRDFFNSLGDSLKRQNNVRLPEPSEAVDGGMYNPYNPSLFQDNDDLGFGFENIV